MVVVPQAEGLQKLTSISRRPGPFEAVVLLRSCAGPLQPARALAWSASGRCGGVHDDLTCFCSC
eukprot:1083057-Pyramimonas_sp.AAC.4